MITLSLVAALGLSACSGSTPTAETPTQVQPPATAPAPANGDDHSKDAAGNTPSTTGTNKPSTPAAPSENAELASLISPQAVAAIDAALATQPGTLVGLDTSDDNGNEWEIDILPESAKRPVEVKVKDGVVVSTNPDTDDNEDLNLTGVTVTMEQAIHKAKTLAQGRFDSIDLDMHPGNAPTWEVDIDDTTKDADHKVYINAVTGETTQRTE